MPSFSWAHSLYYNSDRGRNTLVTMLFCLLSMVALSQSATYTNAGTYTWICPAGVTSVTVQTWGGGGAGGAATNNTSGGGGGGGGAFNTAIVPVTPGNIYTLAVGAGGKGMVSANGGNGNASYFNLSNALANGGSGGALNGAGGNGGVAGAVPNYAGGSGAAGSGITSGGGGGSAGSASVGGNATGATGGAAGSGTSPGMPGRTGVASGNSSSNGLSGASPGAGGSGGWKGNGSSGTNIGGDGGDGKLILTWSCSGINISNLATTASSACTNGNATVTVSSNTLASGTYPVYYNLSGANNATAQSASLNFTAGTPGTGAFTVPGLTNAGSTIVTITSIGCASATTNNSATFAVNQVPAVNPPLAASLTVCSGNTTNIALTATVSSNFSWTIGNITGGITGASAGSGATIGQTLTNPSNATAGTVEYMVTPVSTTGSCAGAPYSVTVTVNPIPVVTTNNAFSICSGASTNISLTATAISSFSWTLGASPGGITGASPGSGPTISQTLTNPSNAAVGSIVYNITASASGCASSAYPITVTVNPKPALTNASTTSICSEESPNITLTASTASSFTWMIGTTSGNISGASASSGATINQILTNSSNSSAGSVQYQVTPTSTTGSCVGNNSTITVTVNPKPAVTTAATKAICSGTSTNISLTASAASTFTWSIGAITGGINGATACASSCGNTINQVLTNPSSTLAGTVEYIVTPVSTTGGCAGMPFTITVTVNPAPVVTTPSTDAICSASTTNIPLSASVSSTFSWTLGTNTGSITGASAASGNSIQQTLTNPSNSTAGSIVYNVTPVSTTGSCTGAVFPITVTVKPIPVITAVGNQQVCNGLMTSAVNFSSSVAGSTFNWVNNNPSIGLALSGMGNIPAFTATNSGNIDQVGSISVTPLAAGCSGTNGQFSITVYPTPNVVANPSSQTICSNINISSITFSGNVAGTTFSWNRDNPVGITGTGGVTNASGTGNITGSFSNTLSSPVSVNFSVTPSYMGCTGATVNGISIVKVNPVPSVSVSPSTAQTVCNGANTTAVTFSGTGTSYNWTNDNISIGLAASGSGNIPAFVAMNSGNAPSTATITVTPVFTADAVNCNGSQQSVSYIVNPVAVLTSGAPSPAFSCSGSQFNYVPATNVTGVNGTTSFAWTRNTVAGIGNPAANGMGNISESLTNSTAAPINVTYNYSLSITHNSVTCANPTSFPVTVSVRPTPTIAASPSSLPAICSGSQMVSGIALSNPNNLAGTTFAWSRSNTGNVSGAPASGSGTNIAASTLTNSTASTQSTIFTATVTNNSCSSNATVEQMVYAPIGNNTTLPTAMEADICGISKQVTITPGEATGGTGSYSYQWQMSNTGASDFVDIPGATSYNLVLNIPIAVAFFRRIVTSGPCSSVSEKLQVNQPISGGDLYIITSAASYCQGGAGVDIIISNTVAGASYTLMYNNSGNWMAAPVSPNPLTGTGFSMSYTGVKTAGTYRVVAAISGAGGCTQTLNQVTISVDPLPAEPVTSNPAPICNGSSSNIVATTSPSNIKVNWYADNSSLSPLNPTPISSGTSYSVNPASTTTYYAAAISSAGCISATRATATVTVNPLPVMTSASSATICTGGSVSIPLTNNVSGTATYSWLATDNPLVTGESTTSQSAPTLSNTLTLPAGAMVAQNVNYTVRATVNGCQGPVQNVVVAVDPKPVINNYTITAICSGNSFVSTPPMAGNTVPASPATLYTWTSPTGSPAISGGSSESVPQTSISQTLTNSTSATANAIYTITPSAGSCIGNSFTMTVPVNPLPVIVGTQTANACSEAPFSFAPANGVNGNVVPAGTTYTWPLPNGSFITGLQVSAGAQASVNGTLTNTSNPAAVQVANYSVTANASGCSSTFTLNVSVNPRFKAQLDNSTVMNCTGAPVILNVTVYGIGSFSGSLTGGIIFSGTATSSPTVIPVSVTPEATTIYSITSLVNTTNSANCSSYASELSGNVTVTVPVVGAQPGGLWTGSYNNDWFDCRNWADGLIPTLATDVNIQAGAMRDCEINGAIAYCRNLTINRKLSFGTIGSALHIAGNWNNQIGIAGFIAGNGEVRFMSNASKQTIFTAGGTETFYNLTIANYSNQSTADEVQLQSTVNVSYQLKMERGRLKTTGQTFTITNGEVFGVVATAAGDDTYVYGPMQWITSGAGEFHFPVGKPNAPYRSYRPAWIVPETAPAAGPPSTTTFSAEYWPSAGPNLGSRTFLGILNTEHWILERPSGAAKARVKLIYLKPANNGNWTDIEPCYNCNVAIAKQYGSTWHFTNFPDNTTGFNTSLPEARFWGDAEGALYSKLLDAFSPFTFGHDYPIILGAGSGKLPVPLRLLSFDARLVQRDAVLDFAVDSVSKLEMIQVEHSRDGQQYVQLEILRSSGSGQFRFVHQQLETGTHHYRIVAIDKSGARIFSETKKLIVGKNYDITIIRNLPYTMVRNQVIADIASPTIQKVYCRIVAANGMASVEQQSMLQPGDNRVPVQTAQLFQGMYFLQVRTGDGTHRTLKFMKE